MAFIVLFGLPAAGKTFTGNVFKKSFGYELYEGDTDMTAAMRAAVKAQEPFTDEMRSAFFKKLLTSIHRTLSKNKNLVVTQTFIKNTYRQMVLDQIPKVTFILINTDIKLREKRLQARDDYPLDLNYARKMASLFEPPNFDHYIITNNREGTENLEKQIEKLLPKLKE